jgi:transposase
VAHRHSDEFKRDAARIALTSSLTCQQVSADLGVGLSTQAKWVKAFSEEASPIGPDQNLVRENDRLRRENRILKEEREVLKNAAIFFAGQKQ